MKNVLNIIEGVIAAIILLFGCSIFKNVVDKMWESIEKLFGESLSSYIAFFTLAAIVIAFIYMIVK